MRQYKADAKTLAKIWRIRLGSAQQTLKTTTQVGVRHSVHLLTRQYTANIIIGRKAGRLDMTMYFDTLFSKFRSLNGTKCEQLFTDNEFISLHTSKSKAGAEDCLNKFIDDIVIPMNMNFDYAADFSGVGTEFMKSIKNHSAQFFQ